MAEPRRFSKKSLQLKAASRQNLEEALTQWNEQFNDGQGSPSDSTVAKAAPMGRETVGDVRTGRKGVTATSIAKLFALTDIDFVLERECEPFFNLFQEGKSTLRLESQGTSNTPKPKSSRVGDFPDIINQLKPALEGLDYEAQDTMYKQFLRCTARSGSPAGAFLIHGANRSGQ